MKVYQVTRKAFYKIETKYGETEVQLADCGEIPETFSSRKKAESRFNEILENHKEATVELFPNEHFVYNWLNYRTVVNLLEVEVY